MTRRLLAASAVVAAFAVSAFALPPLRLHDECPTVVSFRASTESLMGLLTELGETPPEDYMTVDLELSTGDGIPDFYQLMLLAAALCSGDGALNGQYAANCAAIAQYVTVVDDFAEWAASAQVHAATASSELDLLMAWPMYALAPAEAQATIAEFAAMLATLHEAAAAISDPEGEFAGIREQLDDLTGVIAGAAGLSSEMRATFVQAVEEMLAELFVYQPELAATADSLEALAGSMDLLLFAYQRKTELKNSVLALVDDLRALDDLIDRLHFPALAIYGAEKAEGEPFSALGDYDGDGTDNLGVYGIVAVRGGAVASFVKAASGADPFYDAESVPAAGAIGLAVLAAVIAVAGAFVLFRRPR